jgi:hypothetical protein
MVATILLEILAGIGFLSVGVLSFRSARARCDEMRVYARARADRAKPHWRWFFYPRWWYETGQDFRAARGSAIGLILCGIVFLVAASRTAFHLHQ